MLRLFFVSMPLFFFSCGQKAPATREVPVKVTPVPVFDADSAYVYTARQVSFGPRVPNTEAHKACGDYLVKELERFGAKVFEQATVVTAYNGTPLQIRNIIGSFCPEKNKRVLLFAHWDTRPFADQDHDPANHYRPIDGADDGASGTGVLLEIARLAGQQMPDRGIDIIFFDAEDYGTHALETSAVQNPWCLGSQFWAARPHVSGYQAEYGILLDMTGAKDATFFKEGTSVYYAAPVVEKVWDAARRLGYGKYFIPANDGTITDDHLYLIRGRRIPCIDIINFDPESPTGFGPHWHTMDDTMDNIDRQTLKAVGQTLLEVIYHP